MRQLISRAMCQPDDLVVEFDYCDAKGARTHRVVSPIRFLGRDRFLALHRQEPDASVPLGRTPPGWRDASATDKPQPGRVGWR